MKRIGLLLSCDPNFGGTYQYCLNLLDALASLPRKEFQPVVAYIDSLWIEHLKPYFKLESYNLSWDDGLIPPCDLWVFPSQEGWDFQKQVPVLTAIHDLMHRYESRFPEVSEAGEFVARETIYHNICRWSAGVLVDSEIGRQHVHESYGLPMNKIFVLPFLPPGYVNVSESTAPQDFDQLTLPRKYIFYPSHFWRHKNHIRLIRAVKSLSAELPDIHLVFTGMEKDGLNGIIKLIQRLDMQDRVFMLGYVPNAYIPELFKRARAMVMPTLFGPTNIPPLEAFALGCPVAVSRIYGMPDQVGDAALLFDPESIEEIAACVKLLWTDDLLCRELVRKGKERGAQWGQREFNRTFLNIIRGLTS